MKLKFLDYKLWPNHFKNANLHIALACNNLEKCQLTFAKMQSIEGYFCVLIQDDNGEYNLAVMVEDVPEEEIQSWGSPDDNPQY